MENLSTCILCGSDRLQPVDPACNIVGCVACGLEFDNPRPSQEEIHAFYSEAGQYDEWLAEAQGRDLLWRRRLQIVNRYRRSGSLLDIGAGTGQFLHFAKEHYSIVGTDVSREAARIASSQYGINLLDVPLKKFLDEGTHFDIITLFHVFEHVPQPGETLAECYRLLKPGGIVVIAVPNEAALTRSAVKRALNRVFRRVGLRGFRVQPRRELLSLAQGQTREVHLSHFSPEVLRSALKRAGFKILAESIDPYFTSVGLKLIYRRADFALFRFLRFISRHNWYETILIVGAKE